DCFAPHHRLPDRPDRLLYAAVCAGGRAHRRRAAGVLVHRRRIESGWTAALTVEPPRSRVGCEAGRVRLLTSAATKSQRVSECSTTGMTFVRRAIGLLPRAWRARRSLHRPSGRTRRPM